MEKVNSIVEIERDKDYSTQGLVNYAINTRLYISG